MSGYHTDDVTVHHGDALDVLAGMPDASVDAVVTDPPYGLEFMGKDWDAPWRKYDSDTDRAYVSEGRTAPKFQTMKPSFAAGLPFQQWCEAWAVECLRLLRPGGHLLAFGGTRTFHRLACAIEDAGFEIRDTISYQHMKHVFCQCSPVPYNHDDVSPEGVPGVRGDVAADDPLPGDAEPDLLQGVRGQGDQPDEDGRAPAGAAQADNGQVRGMRRAVRDSHLPPYAGQEPDVLAQVQRGAAGSGVGQARPQGAGRVDGRQPGELPREDDRRAEPSLEGRGDLLAKEGELPADQVRQGAGVGTTDGPQGRVHHGTPPDHGDDRGASAVADGGRSPSGPQPAEQRPDELGALAVEWIAQGGGAWPGCPRCHKPLAPPFEGGHLVWNYGSGFPKSLDVSKAIDRANGRKFEDRFTLGRHIRERREALGFTRAQVNAWFGYRDGCEHWERQDHSGARVPTLADFAILRDRLGLSDEHLPLVERVEAEREVVGQGHRKNDRDATSIRLGRVADDYDITAPATDDARRWQGWGTALKPAWEPVIVARKPLSGTVASTVLAHGTGALNVAACRVGADVDTTRPKGNGQGAFPHNDDSWEPHLEVGGTATGGRWPANVVLDEDAAAQLDRVTGVTQSVPDKGLTNRTGDPDWRMTQGNGYADSGGASRFYYTAKAAPDERPRVNGVSHPTIKPLDLMRWLVRLVTPPGGLVLDPFAGSGTTGEACIIEGFRAVLIEREADYLPLIEARLSKPIQPTLGGTA